MRARGAFARPRRIDWSLPIARIDWGVSGAKGGAKGGEDRGATPIVTTVVIVTTQTWRIACASSAIATHAAAIAQVDLMVGEMGGVMARGATAAMVGATGMIGIATTTIGIGTIGIGTTEIAMIGMGAGTRIAVRTAGTDTTIGTAMATATGATISSSGPAIITSAIGPYIDTPDRVSTSVEAILVTASALMHA